MKYLGIDLGSNSLGWAVIEDQLFLAQGVVLFDEGIKREKGKDSLETPAAERRKKRMGRRLKFRRRLRKLRVLKLLIDNGMCPLSGTEWDQLKNYGIVPDNPAYREWLKSIPSQLPQHTNPYYARAMAATKQIDPMLLGRALYHLAQRRGFKSSRKDNLQDETNSARAKELGAVKGDIARISQALEEQNCTLGQYLYVLNQRGEKIRKIHLGRVEHYEKEFARIAEVQNLSPALKEDLHRALFSQRPLRPQSFLVGKCPLETLRPRCQLGHPLFEEFRMYSFLNTIRVDEEAGMRFLTRDEREKLIPLFYRKSKKASFKFADIAKALFPKKRGTDQTATIAFNYNPEKSLSGNPVSIQLNDLFGMPYQEWSHVVCLNGKEVKYDYQTVLDALVFFDDDEKLRQFSLTKLGFSTEQTEKLLAIRIPEGNGQYSLCAIRKIMPFLRAGMELSRAVWFAKLPDLLGLKRWEKDGLKILRDVDEICDGYKKDKEHYDPKSPLIPLQTRLKNYLEYDLNLTPDKVAKIYHHSTSVYAPMQEGETKLPPVELGMLRNPLVQRSLTILRRLVNELRQNGLIDSETRIHIELARSVNDRNTRMAIETWQQMREAKRQNAIQELIKYKLEPDDDMIDRYLLAEEQKFKCFYTDRPINFEKWRDEQFDIEHTVPRSRSGCDAMTNKTICDINFNREIKKGRLPKELPNWDEIDVRLRPWREKVADLEALYQKQRSAAKSVPSDDPARRADARQKMLVTKLELNYWRDKLAFFDATAEDMDDRFMNRQLVDTGIMTRHAVDFLRTLYPHTYSVNGTVVSWARKAWGLQSFYKQKERTDHTHHAVDAMVIASMDRERFRQICTNFRDDGTQMYWNRQTFYGSIVPFEGFQLALKNAVDTILIKSYCRHHELKQTWSANHYLAKPLHLADGSTRKKVASGGDTIRGQLHADTFYGKIMDPKTKEEIFVVRKFIDDNATFTKLEDLDKIVDETVAQTLKEQIQALLDSGMEFKKAICEPLWMKKPDADGNGGVRIKRVRIKTKYADLHQLKRQLTPSVQEYKNYYYVDSAKDSNFRCALYRQQTERRGVITPCRVIKIDNLLSYAQSCKKADFIPWEQRKDLGEFLGFVYPGQAVLFYENSPEELYDMTKPELSQRLYRFVKIEKGGRATFRYHREGRDSEALGIFLVEEQKTNKNGSASIDYTSPFHLLRTSSGTYLTHALWEGIDFSMTLEGNITFKK